MPTIDVINSGDVSPNGHEFSAQISVKFDNWPMIVDTTIEIDRDDIILMFEFRDPIGGLFLETYHLELKVSSDRLIKDMNICVALRGNDDLKYVLDVGKREMERSKARIHWEHMVKLFGEV